MSEPLAIVLIPGLLCSARLYGEQLPALWRDGPVVLADHTRGDSMAAIARQILAAAPSRFALIGLSMGGYLSFEIMRQAPDRVLRLRAARHDRASGHAGAKRTPPRADGGRPGGAVWRDS